MSLFLREAGRLGLLCRCGYSGLSWSRRLVYFKRMKYFMTTRSLSFTSRLLSVDDKGTSSWTKVDLDKMMEEELENTKKRQLKINVKNLFNGIDSSHNGRNQPPDNLIITNEKSVITKRQVRNQYDSYSRGKNTIGSDQFLSPKKSARKVQKPEKVVNFSYPKVKIPAEYPTSQIGDFDFKKFVEEYTVYDISAEETVSPPERSEFGDFFTSIADELLSKEMYVAKEEWEAVGNRLMENETVRLPPNFEKYWPLRFMHYFANKLENSGGYEVTKSLWDFAQDYYDKKPPPLLMSSYMNILALAGNENKVLEIYDELNLQTKGIPEISVYSQVVAALINTSKWRDCKAITEKMERFYSKMKTLQDCQFLAAYSHQLHGEPDEYEKAMRQLIKKGFDPTESKLANQLLRKMDLESGMKFLWYCRENLWLPGIDMTDAILTLLQRADKHVWSVTPSKIDGRGQCRHCGTTLVPSEGLSEDHFKVLQSEALASLIDGKDIYLKSNPGERRAFLSFCEKYGPFDAVVDGLNLFYARSQHGKANLQEVVTTIKMKYPEKTNILIVLRRHLLKALGITTERDSPAKFRQAFLFPLRNESEDDPYLLMAALSSGQQCMVVSNDDYSDQSFAFGSHLRPLFLAWQRTNQIFYLKERGSINLKWPKEFEHSVQEHSGGIHLPFTVSQSLAAKVRPPNSWLCCLKEHNS